MLDALAAAFARPELLWLVGAVFLAGLVRGFSGFGTGMVYVPVAAQFLPPEQVLATIAIFDIFGPAVIAPRALREANLPDLGRLLIGALVGIPLGLWALSVISEDSFRMGASLLALFLVLILLTGWRYQGRLTPPLVLGTGGLAGFCGGAAGLPGPPVIFVYLASPLPTSVIRANTTLFLLGYDVLLIAALIWGALIGPEVFWLGVLLSVPNAIGNFTGALAFRPGYERVYRGVAYVIIVASAISGLPVWG